MSVARWFVMTSASAIAVLIAGPATAQQLCSNPFFVQQSFPTAGPTETTWRLCWDSTPGWGLIIRFAEFRKSPTSPFVRLFWDAYVSEIFVPYHSGWPRYTDLSYGFPLTTVSTADCPGTTGGTVLAGKVCKVVRDRGVAWKKDTQVRRGQELVLWGAVGAANYNYIIEWAFRDDGVVVGRFGATGQNLSWDDMDTVPHMHNAIWRLDIDLNGCCPNSVHQGIHHENLPGLTATDFDTIIPTETGLEWKPLAFHSLNVYSPTLHNSLGHPSSYHLIPLPSGVARHAEPWTQEDFWVTRYHWSERRPENLPSYISPPENISSADIVVWYMGSLHHHPRDEDGQFINVLGGRYWYGEAHVMWTGFMLKPNDLFDGTPLFP